MNQMNEMNRMFNDPFFRGMGADDMMFEPLFMTPSQMMLMPRMQQQLLQQQQQQQQQLQARGGDRGIIPSKESGADPGSADLTTAGQHHLAQSRRQWLPTVEHMHCDVHEEKDKFTVLAELPGVAREDVRVSMDSGLLTISGEKKQENVDEGDRGGRHLRRAERHYGSFSRSFRLPTASEADKVTAKFENGVLSLIIPKIEPKQDQSKFVLIQ